MGMGSVERAVPHKGQWRVRIWWRDAEGRRRSVYLYGPTERAVLALAQARQSKEAQDVERERAGLLVRRRACPTLTEYVLEHHQAIWLHTGPGYVRRQLVTLGRFVEPRLGAKRLDGITRADVADVLSRMRSSGLSGASCNRCLAALSKVLAHAADAGLVASNICRGPGSRLWMPEPLQVVEAYTREEVRAIVDAALADPRSGSRWGPFIAISAFTGARPSSVQRLQVGDVRLDHAPPIILFRETKNGRDLEVPAVERLVQLLAPLVEGRALTEWLFPAKVVSGRAAGGHISDGYETPWRRACDAAGVRPLSFYALRRSFITGAIDGGVSLTTVRDLAGHSSLAITNRYAGSRSRQHQANALDAVWRGANAVQTEPTTNQSQPHPPKT